MIPDTVADTTHGLELSTSMVRSAPFAPLPASELTASAPPRRPAATLRRNLIDIFRFIDRLNHKEETYKNSKKRIVNKEATHLLTSLHETRQNFD